MDWLAPLLDGDLDPIDWFGEFEGRPKPSRDSLEPVQVETAPWPGLSEPIDVAVYRVDTPSGPVVGFWRSVHGDLPAIPLSLCLMPAFSWADLSADELKCLLAGLTIEQIEKYGPRTEAGPAKAEAWPAPAIGPEGSDAELGAAWQAMIAAGWLEPRVCRIGAQVLRQFPRRRPDGGLEIVAASSKASVVAPVNSALAYAGPLTVAIGKHFFAGGFSAADRARWIAAEWD